MSCEVYANSNEVACKAGDGKVIAAFPDVCLTPPPPPAGPIPIPYPDSSFSKDMQSGSKTVMIKNKEVMLKDQSFYKTSPLGDEAATNGQGASVITHVITGKTYFNAWSMDVMFEGANADRHIDLTTSNHASGPPGTPPNPNLDAMATAKQETKDDKCACCGQSPRMPGHSEGRPMTHDGWYGANKKGADGKLTADAKTRRAEIAKIKKDKVARGCACPLFPEKPCNVFRETTDAERNGPGGINSKWSRSERKRQQVRLGIDDEATVIARQTAAGITVTQRTVELERQINHKTPRSAGGCPTGPGNLAANGKMCQPCQDVDEFQFGAWQKARPLKA